MNGGLDGRALWELNLSGKTYAKIAEFTGLTRSQIAGRIYRYRRELARGEHPPDTKLFEIDIGEAITLEGDWVIIGDVHAPTTDYAFAQLVSAVAERDGIHNLLIAGDIVNNDVFSTHPKKDEPVPWKREKAAARLLLKEWIERFDRIVWSAGNHERRLSKATWGAYGMEDLRDLIIGHSSKVEVSNYGYVTIKTPNGLWRITHPTRYSKTPIKTGSDIAMRKGCHTWVFHQHHLGISWSECGRYIVVNGGGLFEPARMGYVMLDDQIMPAMAKGFGTLVNGFARLYGEHPFTDWDRELAA